jgi:hypothetical protein
VRRALIPALVVLLGVSCGAGVRWERPGGTEAERRRDETECAGLANRDRSVPVQRSTTGSSMRRGQDGIELVTVRDSDSGVFHECMKSRGYQQVPGRQPG